MHVAGPTLGTRETPLDLAPKEYQGGAVMPEPEATQNDTHLIEQQTSRHPKVTMKHPKQARSEKAPKKASKKSFIEKATRHTSRRKKL